MSSVQLLRGTEGDSEYDLDFAILGYDSDESGDEVDESEEANDTPEESDMVRRAPIDYSWEVLKDIADRSHRQKFTVIQDRYKKLKQRTQLNRLDAGIAEAGADRRILELSITWSMEASIHGSQQPSSVRESSSSSPIGNRRE